MAFPIYIPSLHRGGCATTCALLESIPLPYYLITTHQEMPLYAKFYPTAHLLPLQREGMTMGQVRNLVLDHARDQHASWIWMLDDDVTNIYVRTQKTRILSTMLLLRAIEPSILRMPVSFAGLDPYTSEHPFENSIFMDTWAYCCVAMNVADIGGLRYDDALDFHEDCDFLLRLLTHGLHTMRFSRYAYKTPPNGVVEGGMKDRYTDERLEQDAAIMVKRWPMCFLGKDKRGRTNIIPDFSYFARHPIQDYT